MRHIRSSDIKIAVGIFTIFGIVFFVAKGRDGGAEIDSAPALVVAPMVTTELEVVGEQLDVGEKNEQKPMMTEVEKSLPVAPPISDYQVETILFHGL